VPLIVGGAVALVVAALALFRRRSRRVDLGTVSGQWIAEQQSNQQE
jgi:hypothetical protein